MPNQKEIETLMRPEAVDAKFEAYSRGARDTLRAILAICESTGKQTFESGLITRHKASVNSRDPNLILQSSVEGLLTKTELTLLINSSHYTIWKQITGQFPYHRIEAWVANTTPREVTNPRIILINEEPEANRRSGLLEVKLIPPELKTTFDEIRKKIIVSVPGIFVGTKEVELSGIQDTRIDQLLDSFREKLEIASKGRSPRNQKN